MNKTFKQEQDIWFEVTKDVIPLDKTQNTVNFDKTDKASSTKNIILKKTMQIRNKTNNRAEIDRKKAKEIKNKGLKTNARLDLHGLTQDQAYSRLCRFIENNWLKGIRNLLIITGKGKNEEGSGVLRQMLPRWLLEPQFNKMILYITTANPQDGGDGAFYVVLRKNNR